jgi:mannose-1-phosphate guanylyltransferase
MFECEGCVVRTSSLKKVVLQGLEDYIVAEKDGSLLVCKLSEEQRIKDFSK